VFLKELLLFAQFTEFFIHDRIDGGVGVGSLSEHLLEAGQLVRDSFDLNGHPVAIASSKSFFLLLLLIF